MARGSGVNVSRGIYSVSKEFTDFTQTSRNLAGELRNVENGLRNNADSSELASRKTEIFNQQIANARDRAAELQHQMQLLNPTLDANGNIVSDNDKRYASLDRQLRMTKDEIEGLTGANKTFEEQQKRSKLGADEFSKSMTELQSNLRAGRQVIHGISSAFTLLGGDKDSAMGKTLQQGEKVFQIMSGLSSMGKLLKNQNMLTAGSFSNLALSAGAAFAAFTLADTLLGKFDGTSRKVAGAVAILAGAVTAGAVAWMAYHGTMTLGVAVPVILAALAVGAAGIKALTTKTKSETDALSTVTSSASTVSTPSVPTYSSGGSTSGSTTYISQGGITEGQMEMASYRGFVRAITETGLNDPKFIGALNIDGKRFADIAFNDILDVNSRRGRPLATR